MRKHVVIVVAGFMLALSLFLALGACSNSSGGGGSSAAVSDLSLDSKVTAPERDAQPDTTAINEAQYTGTVAWQTADGTAHTGAFAAATVYKAIVTLTAKGGYTFSGVAANSFTYSGATVTNAAGSGVVTITFPATAAPSGNTVTAFSLDGKVTAPAQGAMPNTAAINETQYTGTVAWQREDGTAHTGAFAASTVYKAVVTLTAKSGYTFDGVAANSFTYSGATSVANNANSGIVTITFPATGDSSSDTPVNALSLNSLITAPVRDGTPDTTAINETQYTGTVAWQTSSGAAHTGAFAASTVYKAVVTLTAQSGYTFTGVAANSFTYSGATSVANNANSGIVTITFPATGAPLDVAVSAFSLDGLVTAPVRDATPNTTAINETQYTGTVAWQTAGGAAHTGAFAASTVYKAVVTLTAQSGYTFTGVAANSFTYSGATSVANNANSGIVTITFPATGAAIPPAEVPIGSPSVKLYLDGGTTALTHNGTTSITRGAGTYTVGIAAGSYTAILWRLNGNELPTARDRTSVVLSKQTAGTYQITVEATPNGGAKQSGAHSFTVQ
jgi:transcriptional antiterminator Rof (Rho-off)